MSSCCTRGLLCTVAHKKKMEMTHLHAVKTTTIHKTIKILPRTTLQMREPSRVAAQVGEGKEGMVLWEGHVYGYVYMYEKPLLVWGWEHLQCSRVGPRAPATLVQVGLQVPVILTWVGLWAHPHTPASQLWTAHRPVVACGPQIGDPCAKWEHENAPQKHFFPTSKHSWPKCFWLG